MLSNSSAGLSCIEGALHSGAGHWNKAGVGQSKGSERQSKRSERQSKGSEQLSKGSEWLSKGSEIRYRQGGYITANYLSTINQVS